ncbi:18093_t:CDS:10 [Funneliformis geosporum]|uniref:6793_t:CDS:1 n=1 Tax=Funneliformis geosporum TaxID=1117311 RepID=A0A9W4SCH4_9GLOM|nr:18093_t:CDS:10 [Funneliformis geosporum]CAI2163345.1 6793_t:CDS:10 [Funneliformis geosporum]
MSTTAIPATVITEPARNLNDTMIAVEWHGNTDVRVNSKRKRPELTQPTDAIVRITGTTICGSDLHLYHNEIPGMERADVLGHEGVGVVVEVGEKVANVKPNNRVVISAVIACGQCEYCQKKMFSCCDVTNPSKEMEELYGHRTAGLFGYSHLTGGYDGLQAEYVRVPYADVNLLPVSEEDYHALGEKLVLLSDVACTGWHANELGEVSKGDIVGIWGCGPIGLSAIAWAKYRGASRIIGIDCITERLCKAHDLGAETINFKEHKDIVAKIKVFVPGGLDVAIECAGFRYTKTIKQQVEKTLFSETDNIDALSEAIRCVKKGGNVSIIGDFVGTAAHFPIGAVMEKSLTLRGGQVQVQKYWAELLSLMKSNKVNMNFFTHHGKLADADKFYKIFDKKENGIVKVFLSVGDQGERQPEKY